VSEENFTMSQLADRLRRVEERLDELDHRPEPPRALNPGAEPLWALNGLQEVTQDPAGAVLLTGAVTIPRGGQARWQISSEAQELFDSDFADRADKLSALAQPVRLQLLQRIMTDATTVNDLLETGEFGTSGQIYHHLRQLVSAGWVETVGKSKYAVPASRVVPILVILLAVDR
jgi:hypothetical protein